MTLHEGDVDYRAGHAVKSIEGLRGVSALAVLAYHAGAVAALAIGGWFAVVFGGGGAAVYIFFCLSAYLLTRNALAGHYVTWGQFYRSRFWRIFPSYWAVLPLFFAALVVPVSVGAVFLLQLWWPAWNGGVIGHGSNAWTLCVEVVFYAVFPLWFRAAKAWPRLLLVLSGVATAVYVLDTAVLHGDLGISALPAALFSYALGTWVGMGRSFPGARFAVPALFGAFALAAVLPGYEMAFMPLAAAAFLAAPHPAWARLRWLGAYAYPVYLIGYPLLWFCLRLGALPLVAVGVDVVGTLGLAVAVHHLVEVPGIRLGHRLEGWFAKRRMNRRYGTTV